MHIVYVINKSSQLENLILHINVLLFIEIFINLKNFYEKKLSVMHALKTAISDSLLSSMNFLVMVH